MNNLIKYVLLYVNMYTSIFAEVRYDDYKVFRLTPTTEEDVKFLNDLKTKDISGYDFWNDVRSIGIPVNVMVPPYEVSDLEVLIRKTRMISSVMMDNVQDKIDAEKSENEGDEDFGWTKYYTLDEINEWLKDMVDSFPSNATLIELTKTYENRTIYGIKISNGESKTNRSVFIDANIHGREWVTSAIATYIINELLIADNENTTILKLVEEHDWYIFPVANPDGFEYSHTEDRLWRKTRVQHSMLCAGADPNRNWDPYWAQGGSSYSPCSNLYHGPKPFSEPCTKILSEYIKTLGHELVAYISLHSFSQVLLLPFGHTSELLLNYKEAHHIGVKAMARLSRYYGTQYRVGSTYNIMYQASGGSADWVKAVFETPLVYTMEVRDEGQYGFLLPPEQILPTAIETWDGITGILEEYYKIHKT